MTNKDIKDIAIALIVSVILVVFSYILFLV